MFNKIIYFFIFFISFTTFNMDSMFSKQAPSQARQHKEANSAIKALNFCVKFRRAAKINFEKCLSFFSKQFSDALKGFDKFTLKEQDTIVKNYTQQLKISDHNVKQLAADVETKKKAYEDTQLIGEFTEYKKALNKYLSAKARNYVLRQTIEKAVNLQNQKNLQQAKEIKEALNESIKAQECKTIDDAIHDVISKEHTEVAEKQYPDSLKRQDQSKDELDFHKEFQKAKNTETEKQVDSSSPEAFVRKIKPLNNENQKNENSSFSPKKIDNFLNKANTKIANGLAKSLFNFNVSEGFPEANTPSSSSYQNARDVETLRRSFAQLPENIFNLIENLKAQTPVKMLDIQDLTASTINTKNEAQSSSEHLILLENHIENDSKMTSLGKDFVKVCLGLALSKSKDIEPVVKQLAMIYEVPEKDLMDACIRETAKSYMYKGELPGKNNTVPACPSVQADPSKTENNCLKAQKPEECPSNSIAQTDFSTNFQTTTLKFKGPSPEDEVSLWEHLQKKEGIGINKDLSIRVGNFGGVNCSITPAAAASVLSTIKNFLCDPIPTFAPREIKQTECFKELEKHYTQKGTFTSFDNQKFITQAESSILRMNKELFANQSDKAQIQLINHLEKHFKKFEQKANFWKKSLKTAKKNTTCYAHYNYIECQAHANVIKKEIAILKEINKSDYTKRLEIIKNQESYKQRSEFHKIRKEQENLLPMGKIYKVVCDARTGKVIEAGIAQDKNFEEPTIKIKDVDTCTIDRHDIIIPQKEVSERSLKDAEIIYKEYNHLQEANKEQKEGISIQEKSEIYFLYETQEKNEQERLEASGKDLENKSKFRTEEFQISEALKQELLKKGKNPKEFAQFVGNESQYISQKQNIEAANKIIEASSIITDNQEELGNLKELGLDFVLTATEYNKIGSVIKANECTDAAYVVASVLTEAASLTVSVAQGGLEKTIDMAKHPVKTITDIGLGFVHLGIFAAQTLVEGVDIAATTMVAKTNLDGFKMIPRVDNLLEKLQSAAQGRLDQKCEFLKNAFYTIYQKTDNYLRTTPRHEIAKQGGAFLAEMLITGKLGKNFYRFFGKIAPVAGKFARKTASKIAEKSKQFAKELKKGEQILTAAGQEFNIPIVVETMDATKYAARNAKKLAKKLAKKTHTLKKTTKETLKPVLIEVGEHAKTIKKYYKGFTKPEAIKLIEKFGKKFIIKSEATLEKLRAAGFNGDSLEFTTSYWQHVLGVEHVVEKYASGAVRIIKKGGHFVKNRALKLKNITTKANKIIEGKIKNIKIKNVGNKTFAKSNSSGKTLFPRAWSIEVVENKIIESLENISTQTKFVRQGNGRIIFTSKTNCGIEIQHVIDKTGKLITSFPII